MSERYIQSSTSYSTEPQKLDFRTHTHESYKLYCMLCGDVEFFVEGNLYIPQPGDILIMKKAEAHAMQAKSNALYRRMVVHFNEKALLCDQQESRHIFDFLEERPLGKENLFSATAFPGTNWQFYLNAICGKGDLFQKRLYLTVLLHELSSCQASRSVNLPAKDAITDAIAYINENLTQLLSLEELCKQFFFSKAQLNRRFKKVTGSTVWEYILTKRLLLARTLLRAGEPASAVCGRSGIQNYCTFFRAYKTHFGISPSEDKCAYLQSK